MATTIMAASQKVQIYSSTFQDNVDNAALNWTNYHIEPYVKAYDAAYERFKQNVENQIKVEQKKVELALLAMSVCGGSFLVSAFGSSALKDAAGDMALSVICNNNFEKAFKVATFIKDKNNRTGMTVDFLLGETFTNLQNSAANSLKENLEKSNLFAKQTLTSWLQNTQKPGAADRMQKDMLTDITTPLSNARETIRDHPNLSDDLKIRTLEELSKSPFIAKAPKFHTINIKELSEKIELSLYLSMITKSDTLVKGWYSYHSGFQNEAVKSRTDISKRPNDNNYPRDNLSNPDFGYQTFERVDYSNVGYNLGKTIDDLFKKHDKTRPGKALFDGSDGFWLWKNNIVNAVVVQRAHLSIDTFGEENAKIIGSSLS